MNEEKKKTNLKKDSKKKMTIKPKIDVKDLTRRLDHMVPDPDIDQR